MSRDLTGDFASQLDEDGVEVFFAIELFFDSGTLRFWSGLGDLVIGANTFTGSGQLIQISSVSESADIAATGAQVALSALPSSLLSLALSEPYQGRKCKIYFGMLRNQTDYLLNEDGTLVLNEDGSGIDLRPEESDVLTEIFTGQIDMMNIDEGPETSAIDLKVESRLIELNKPRSRRYTTSNQQARFAGDKGFDFVEDLQQKKFAWGRSV